ncbi:GFA family protein [Rhizobium sp. S96]|uniref:GFA family protein n=1 Tax=Rhizobium sp. S96 TaxID=3055140 RepID=UPI0025AAE2EB|nr:GFA family protein [Rhizobium sp. S96]MDM9620826.1 GFA family protein [Rhizobium sp. S96]
MAGDEHEHSAGKITHGSCHCGEVRWTFRGNIPDATICNCTVCRRYGVLWAYDYDGEGIHVEDPNASLTSYIRGSRQISFNFCNRCGNLVSWRSLTSGDDGRTRIAVNLRLAEPADVDDVPLQRFDGLHSFDDLPLDGRTVGDVWF